MAITDTLLGLISDKKKRDVAFVAGGMLSLLGGRKIVGLSMFAKGAIGLEKNWRAEHPDFDGDFSQRWQRAIEFYESTHDHAVNRKLHIAGIPIILGGTVGLLLFRPYRPAWFVAAGAFTTGWVMNFIGHAIEKKAPAFADDPLSFIAGPAWDLQQMFGHRKPGQPKNGEIFDAAADAPPA
jgi:hypothetical protein